jgi:hypothetical protein
MGETLAWHRSLLNLNPSPRPAERPLLRKYSLFGRKTIAALAAVVKHPLAFPKFIWYKQFTESSVRG